MRVDTTVVETNIHYPTDSTLLGDGVRVLTRTMKKITTIAGDGWRQTARPQPEREAAGAGDRPGGARQRAEQTRSKLKQRYRQLLDATSRVVGQAKRFSEEIAQGVKRPAKH